MPDGNTDCSAYAPAILRNHSEIDSLMLRVSFFLMISYPAYVIALDHASMSTACRMPKLPFHFWIECIAQSITDKVKRKNGKQYEKTCRKPYEYVVTHYIGIIYSIDD